MLQVKPRSECKFGEISMGEFMLRPNPATVELNLRELFGSGKAAENITSQKV